MIRTFFITVCSTVLLTATPVLAQNAAVRAITSVQGDLYRFQNNNHFSVFLVTSEGVIASDPIDREAALWLKQEIQARFQQPVKYLVYSHDHRDHISGGEVFDEAVVVSHVGTKEKIIGEQRPTALPDLTYSQTMTIELGGKTVELIHAGRNHSDNSTVLFFPEERAVFAVDFISVDRMPYRTLNDSNIPDWFDSMKMVEALDFDIMLPGHGVVGTKADVTEHRMYLELLYATVLKGVRAGQGLEAMIEQVRFDQYDHFEQYESALPLNIQGMYRMITANRVGN
ncbi:MAG: MBL fold metallo-hydrolase [Candidatus Latescibacteria bacterium]|nr:MBL fold metallo-hydrolase [Candidatus Latescibacterota bacterium]